MKDVRFVVSAKTFVGHADRITNFVNTASRLCLKPRSYGFDKIIDKDGKPVYDVFVLNCRETIPFARKLACRVFNLKEHVIDGVTTLM